MNDRDLLVLVRTKSENQSLDEAVESLNNILLRVECTDVFCSSHELVMRNTNYFQGKKNIKGHCFR
jgi:hypothetical protein